MTHPAIWLDATYTVAEAAEVTGFTKDVIHGAIKGDRLKATARGHGPTMTYAIAGMDLWKFWRAERRRMRMAADATAAAEAAEEGAE